MYFVYILKSQKYTNKIYIGMTRNIKDRLYQHNHGSTFTTNRFKPWYIASLIIFSSKIKAKNFEKYLKVGSGNAFMKKHLI